MNKNECEARLRAAKPADDEIAPLSPEASARILCAALRANRRRGTFFWLAAPLRVIVSSLATAAAAYCLLPYINTSVMPVAEKPAPSPVITSATKNETASDRIPQAIREPSDRYIPPKLPALLPKPVKPPVMMAKSLVPAPLSPPGGKAGGIRKGFPAGRTVPSSPAPALPSEGGRASMAYPGSQSAASDEGNMYVSVTGDSILPPESESYDDLTVTVERNVPDTVPGSAEAAALHAIPVPTATPNPADAGTLPVWTHVRVETGEEPVLTLTALH